MTTSSNSSWTEEALLAVVAEQLELVAPELAVEALDMDKSLRDLGCNSVDRADIVSLSLEALDLDIPIHELATVDDLRSLVLLLREKLAA